MPEAALYLFCKVSDHQVENYVLLKKDCQNKSLYPFPGIDAKKLLVLDIGSTLSVLCNFKASASEIWVRVELPSNKILDDPNKINKGWIKM